MGVTDADAALAQESDRHRGQRAALAQHRDVPLGARRIDRENPALEAELVEVMHRPAADLVRIFRRTDDGDGFWIECGLKTAHDLVLAKYGTRRPANCANRAVTLSPMERSLSPWAIMRKPSTVSTRTIL